MFEVGQKVYWVKYALTSGIQERVLEERGRSENLWFVKKLPQERGFISVYEREIYTSLNEAMGAVEVLREKKIKSLQKQIDKLESLQVRVN